MSNLTPEELELAAYATGDIVTAALYARIAELEDRVAELENQLDDAASASLAQWEKNYGPADAYKQFFEDCFARLDGYYPCPSVTSDYDVSVIFARIDRGEIAE